MSDMDEHLQRLLKGTYELKDAKDKITIKYEAAQAELVEYMSAKQQKTASAQIDDQRLAGTLVRNERLSVDETALKKAVGAKTWHTVTTEKLDRSKLEQAVADGKIDSITVSACSTLSFDKPYVRLTLKDIED